MRLATLIHDDQGGTFPERDLVGLEVPGRIWSSSRCRVWATPERTKPRDRGRTRSLKRMVAGACFRPFLGFASCNDAAGRLRELDHSPAETKTPRSTGRLRVGNQPWSVLALAASTSNTGKSEAQQSERGGLRYGVKSAAANRDVTRERRRDTVRVSVHYG